MRVALNGLFLANPSTGTGQYLRELVRALRAISPLDEFVLIAPRADRTAPPPLQIAPTRLPGRNFAKLEFEQLTFPRASVRFDVAHIPHFASPFFPTHPTVVTIHDLIPLVLPAYRGSSFVQLYTFLAAQSAKRADAIIVDSHASARDVRKHLQIPRQKLYVVHLAADARFHPPGAAHVARVRAKYALPENFALYLGGFDVRKNVRRVLETFASVQDAKADTSLVIAGKLPDAKTDFFPDPLNMAETYGVRAQTHFIGFVSEEDKPGLYAAARVFLYPSHYEGFGLPPLEAMACGTPVLSSNASSLPEVVGEGGILLNPDDARRWSDALWEVLTNDARWNELRARGLEKASRFSWERTARETLAVYQKVYNQRRGDK